MLGTPNQALRGPAFAEFEPIRVMPTYPDWIVDTPGGIATLTIVCLAIAATIPLLLLLCKKKRWLCFKPKYGFAYFLSKQIRFLIHDFFPLLMYFYCNMC